MIFLKIAIGLFITAWICANIYKTHCKSCREMYDELVAGQCLIGMIAANLLFHIWMSLIDDPREFSTVAANNYELSFDDVFYGLDCCG